MSKKEYTYDDPQERGYKKFEITKKQHNHLFPNRKRKWNTTYEYFYNEHRVMLHQFSSKKAIIMTTLLFPVLILFAGLSNFKEAITEMKWLYNEKKYGKFSSDWISKGQYHKGDNEKYFEIIRVIEQGK